MATLQSTARRKSYAINYIKTPRWVEIIAILWLVLEDHIIPALRVWISKIVPALRIMIARNEVCVLVKYDRTQRAVTAYRWLFPVARVFTGLWFAFLLIALLEGVVKWLH